MAQRDFRQHWADHLYATFNLEKFAPPTVNERDGSYYIVNGQHSTDAFKRWIGDGWEDQQVQCWTYVGLSEAEEAELFLSLSDTLTISTFDKFRIAKTAGRELETDIDRTVRAQGLVVSRDGVPGAVRAVATLRKVYTRSDGAPTLARTLRIIRDAYGDPGLEAAVIDGIGHLCQRYNGQLDEQATVERLSRAHGGVNGLLAKAEVLRKQTGNYKSHCVAAAAVDIINASRGGKKLPSWWSQP
jgi:hypothetical protein